ncbi:MAG: galactosyldiacylglycerol synthase [Anaerolineae bacterium]|nr:galactosyldiacylglycerol synthase [Anaerolineae bacterium]
MIHLQPDLPRILFIFSDTGGGHRSAAQAIIEAIQLEFPDRFDCQMVDIFRSYMPTPLKYAPEIYPPLSRMPELWELGYRASDGPRRKRLIDSATYPYISRALKRFIRENPCELFVSVHQMVNTPMLKALAGSATPFVTVVTDMVSTHAFWYDTRATKVIVPTQAAYQRGLCMGLRPEQMEVVGMPVAERFCQPLAEKKELRRHLNWDTNMPIVLLVGGGEGMGPLAKTARAINEAQLPISLVVVTGRNRQIKAELENLSWNIPAYVYGFVTQMPEFMRAADILVTKAGPGTISEAFIAQLPMILYSKMPGQEDGNVDFVVKEEAGIWAPTPGRVVAALRYWLEHPDAREKAVESCRRLARPQASRQIARILAAQVNVRYQEKVYADS